MEKFLSKKYCININFRKISMLREIVFIYIDQTNYFVPISVSNQTTVIFPSLRITFRDLRISDTDR